MANELTYDQVRSIVLGATSDQCAHMLCFMLGYLKSYPEDGWGGLVMAIRAEGLMPHDDQNPSQDGSQLRQDAPGSKVRG